MLKKLVPVGKLEMDGISLVVKYSTDNPDILMSCDDNGKIYLLNSLTSNKNSIPDYPEKIKTISSL